MKVLRLRWKRSKKESMKRVIKITFALIGTVAFVLSLSWGISLVFFVFGEGGYPGVIARLPFWIFPLSVLMVFWKTRDAEEFLEEIIDRFF